MTRLREKLIVGGALAVLSAGFAWLNGGIRVDVNLGLVRLSAVPLPVVVFAAFLLGMLTLFLAGLKAELRTQRMLRRYRDLLGAEEPPDANAPPAGPSADLSEEHADAGRSGGDPATDEV